VNEVAIALFASLLAGVAVWRLSVRSMGRMKRGIAADRARFEALAHEDPLTGLPNKRAFDDRLENELRRATREYYPVAMVVLALDRVEEADGSRAPEAGDEMLVKFARQITAELRAGDICGRIGPGEFGLAMVRADSHSAERVLVRLRRALEGMSGPSGERIDLRAGVAEFPRHAQDRGKLISYAEAALLQGGANGGGAATIHSPASPGLPVASPYQPGRAVRERNQAVSQQSLVETLQTMAKAVDAKNRFTAGHSERVATYAVTLARSLGFSQDRLDAIRQAALLHDVGKIGIRETILTKEAPLNLEEMEELERHSELGRAMLAGAGMPELARWVNHLHERFDGDGYPYGLAGREIPVESRLLHVADALDQMSRPSSLRRNRPLREALAELSYSAGSRVDPEIAARAIELVQAGELKLADPESARPSGRRAMERQRARPSC
jgi:diguanylate cyclase (GGDEF)-like protein